MTEAELLQQIKIGMGFADTFHDEALKLRINEMKDFMRSKGVKEDVINSPASVGCILAGVNDLYYYASGGVKLSDYTVKRVIQLKHKKADEVTNNVQTE